MSRPAFTTGHSTRTALTTLQTVVRGVSSGSNSAAEVRTAVDGVTTATGEPWHRVRAKWLHWRGLIRQTAD